MTSSPRSLRPARLATFAFFGLNGFVLGMWVVHIPVIEQRAGISHAVLGWLLLVLGGGAFAGMRLAGPLTDRLGPRAVVPASGVLLSASLALPGLATGAWTLGAALVVLGFFNGCLDVSMNTHAVQVEHRYGRPILSAFHAVFSLGGVAAALVGARTLSWGWGAPGTLAGMGAFGVLVALASASVLLPREATSGAPEPAPAPAPAPAAQPAPERASAAERAPGPGPEQAGTRGRRPVPARIRVLAALAFMLMLCEGVANDWSSLDLRDVLDAPAATAAFAYGAFSTAMTVGRLVTDRVAARFGPVAIVRYGAGLATLGLAVVALTPWIPLALAGWAVFGLGLSGCVPQLFSAAGHADREAAGANVSRVAGLGYLGMLAGPTVIGPLTRLVPLNAALAVPVLLCATAALCAGVLRPRVDPGLTPGPHGTAPGLDGGTPAGTAPAGPARDPGRLG
ncbi:MFS transporter [Streptomyces fuscigenes]|uniref:MFS transporter n=1 Tax=Streptomyces fuscigenes TaxID=1528880 RepID=UPI001F1FB1FA|nr:MFS transporter [Streptomyces fuscigenes]MCF3962931.1 MFS transporter [Streptomyces fuscigenes]